MNTKGNAWIVVGLVFGVIVLAGIILALWVAGSYNNLVQKDESTRQLWGNVQTAYQRRADLIPNLVETVKGAKNFEQETQTQIAKLRSEAGQAQAASANAKTPEELSVANAQATSVLSRLLVIVEAYPDLKSNQNFLGLQDELAGTENRIKWERDKYNEGVKDYGISVRRFPTSLIAGLFGFSYDKWQPFKAEDDAQKAPKVSFS